MNGNVREAADFLMFRRATGEHADLARLVVAAGVPGQRGVCSPLTFLVPAPPASTLPRPCEHTQEPAVCPTGGPPLVVARCRLIGCVLCGIAETRQRRQLPVGPDRLQRGPEGVWQHPDRLSLTLSRVASWVEMHIETMRRRRDWVLGMEGAPCPRHILAQCAWICLSELDPCSSLWDSVAFAEWANLAPKVWQLVPGFDMSAQTGVAFMRSPTPGRKVRVVAQCGRADMELRPSRWEVVELVEHRRFRHSALCFRHFSSLTAKRTRCRAWRSNQATLAITIVIIIRAMVSCGP